MKLCTVDTIHAPMKYHIKCYTWKEKRELCATLNRAFGKEYCMDRSFLKQIKFGQWAWSGNNHYDLLDNVMYDVFLTTDEQLTFIKLSFDFD